MHSEDDEIYIDGVKMPTLKLNGLTYKKEKIWSKNTGRVSNGDMKGDVIARSTHCLASGRRLPGHRLR